MILEDRDSRWNLEPRACMRKLCVCKCKYLCVYSKYQSGTLFLYNMKISFFPNTSLFVADPSGIAKIYKIETSKKFLGETVAD